MPTEASARRVARSVETVAGEVGEVDATDECQLVVDDDELLVVTVHRALVRVQRADDLVAGAERFADRTDGLA